MRIIQNLSIRNKLIGIILLVTILALGSGFTFVIINDIRSFKGEMKNYTVASAQVIGDYCVSPLLFDDRSGAEQILAKFAAVPPIINAIVYDTNEEPFAVFSTSEDAEIMSPTLGESSSKFVDDYLHVFQPIFYKDEYYGMIYLHVSTQLLNEKITNYVRYMALLIAGLIVVSILLAVRLQRIISQPILDLAGVARQITEKGNYAIRVQKKGDDETGLLYDGFNNMLEQIQNREIERDRAEETLKKSNEQLQQEIAERKRAEKELAKYQEHLEELVDTRTLELTHANKQLQQEVAERKRTEKELESLRRLSQRLTGPLTVKEVGRIVAAESRRLFAHDAFALDLVDESTQKQSGIHYEDTPPGGEEPEEVPIVHVHEYITEWRRDVLTGKSKLINRDKDPTDVQVALFGYESRVSRSLMFVAIRWKNRSIGILSVQSYTPDRYSERDLKLLQTFADQCGGALVRVQAEQELKDKQAQLMQSQKMASLGMLVAGVAHEINTPVGAIGSMHDTIMRAVERLKSTLETIGEGEANERRNVNRLFKIIEDGNRVITSGTARVTTIVRRLRSFARLDEAELKEVDVHEGIEDTLTIVHHELKHKVVVERNFGDIPPIACYPGQLNQVYVNLLINAVQAIKDKGTITITTFQKNDHVHIQIVDTGVGIPEELLGKIFDPGVTTKGVGVGTGLGLSICYQIIKDHHGEILVESEVGKGTTFTVVLPTNLDALVESQVSPRRRKERGEG